MYLSYLVLLLICPMKFAAFDKDLAAEILDFAGIAYCVSNNGVINWNCLHCDDHPGITNVTEITNKELNINGYVALNKARNHLILSFAGTDPLSIKDWIVDSY